MDRIRTIELRHLRCFLAVAQEMNFTRAAQTLHMAQPPLSRQIRDLENVLGVDLFDRTTRSVSLTAAGTAFQAEIQKLFPQLEYAVDAARKAAQGHHGRLRLGYTGRASHSLLPSLLREYRAKYPDVTVDIEGPRPTGYLKQELLGERLDIVLCFLPVVEDGLSAIQMLTTNLTIALPTAHRLAQQATLAVTDLSDEKFVAYPAGQGFHLRGAMEAECMRAGFRPSVVRESEASQTLLCLVAAGTGVALMPDDTESLLIDGVVFKPLPRGSIKLEHGIVWHKENTNPALRNLLDLAETMKGAGAKAQIGFGSETSSPAPETIFQRRASRAACNSASDRAP